MAVIIAVLTSRESRVRRLRHVAMDVRPLRHRAFRRLWASTTVTSVGSQLTAVAVPKQIYDITHSSAWVGIASLVGLVPLIVFALWGGSIADVVDRRTMMLVTNAGITVTSVLLWVQAAMGLHSMTLLLVLIAVQQGLFGANSPARGASLPRLVPVEELAAANALNTTVMGMGGIVGPLLAGALIPVLGLSTLYLIDSIALVIATWAVLGLPALPAGLSVDGTPRRAGLRDISDGLRYIRAAPVLLLSFLADIVAMVLGMPRALFPEMSVNSFGDPPGGGLALGLLYAAIPLGALLGGLFSGSLTRLTRHGALVVLAVLGWGVAIVGFGLSGPLWLAVAFLAAAGVADMASMVFRGTILQAAAGDELRGRIQGVFFVVVAGGPRLSDLVHGLGGSVIGTRATVVAGGVLTVVAMGALALARPMFWRYEAEAVVPVE